MKIDRLFSHDDREAIRRATQEAELLTSGEIVPYVVERSDDYPEAAWRGAALLSPLAVLGAALLHNVGGFWQAPLVLWAVLPAIVGAAAGYLLVGLVPGLKRRLADPELVDRRVRRSAVGAFLEQEVFRTRERTGILIFLSLFEHRVVVLGDAGINAKVREGTWDRIVGELALGIRAGRPAKSLVEAIAECGRLLEAHGVERRPDDVDELADHLRTGGEDER